jgi:hypothetical protein
MTRVIHDLKLNQLGNVTHSRNSPHGNAALLKAETDHFWSHRRLHEERKLLRAVLQTTPQLSQIRIFDSGCGVDPALDRLPKHWDKLSCAVLLSPLAVEDIVDLGRYIADQKNPDARRATEAVMSVL